MGPQFVELLEEVGLVQSSLVVAHTERGQGGSIAGHEDLEKRAKKKRKRRLERGWQHGERPDGWISENEARRARKEGRMAIA